MKNEIPHDYFEMPFQQLATILTRQADTLHVPHEKSAQFPKSADSIARKNLALKLLSRIRTLLEKEGYESTVETLEQEIDHYFRSFRTQAEAAYTFMRARREPIAPEILEQALDLTKVPTEYPDILTLIQDVPVTHQTLAATFGGLHAYLGKDRVDEYFREQKVQFGGGQDAV